MKKSLTLLIVFVLFSVAGYSQTTVDVQVSSNVFTPSAISINVGDTVRWTNIGGFHNVNGTTATFPSNPESFGNAVGSGWVYTHVFTISGNYDFHCDPHFSSGMTGSLSVSTVTGMEEISAEDLIKVYPIPSKNVISLNIDQELISEIGFYSLLVYDLLGNQVMSIKNKNTSPLEIDISTLSNSVYFYKIIADNNLVKTGKIIKE